MIREIRDVYKLRLEANDWLSPKTRAKAIEKLNSLRVFVGGPADDDKPIIESMPDVIAPEDGGDLLTNIMHNGVLERQQVRALLGTNFNPDKWYAFDPQDVNAAYIPETTASLFRPVSSSRRSMMPRRHAGPISGASASSSVMKSLMPLIPMAVNTTVKDD